ncbi:MAG: orotate phosphoribosyltransferase [Vampirovibrionales bacterium]|nr:orotate phosphoribosyltransferase [Vampirovibrionales bacterium]
MTATLTPPSPTLLKGQPSTSPFATIPSNDTERLRLLQLIQQHALKFGTFTLASGKQSSYYLDCRLVTLLSEGADLIGRLMARQLLPTQADAVGGVVIGAAPMVTATGLAATAQGLPLNGFLIRKATKGHGTQKLVEGHIAAWMRVVLVEDVVTTAGSLVEGIQALKAEYPSVVVSGVLSLVDRNAGGDQVFQQLGIPYQALFNVNEVIQK